jgi:hypothetical protein
MSKTIRKYWRRESIAFAVFSAVAILVAASFLSNRTVSADKPPAPGQASITLTNCDAQYCYTHNNTWTITKEVTHTTVDPTTGKGMVTWTVTATKDSSAPATFTVHGGLTVTNTGTAPATIGNIVVNLQKPNNQKIAGKLVSWVSTAADGADATGHVTDGASLFDKFNLVAAGSAESQPFNAAFGANNYAVSGAQGTFSETTGSGALNFTDASNNTIFSLVPQPVIAVGGSVTLLYTASFDLTALPPAGTPLRVEALVTFGNAGARGGSGSSAVNIDINGDGVVDNVTGPPQAGEQGANDADEANVRTVPCRVTEPALPATPSECNDSVTVTDTGATSSGTVTTSNPSGFDQFPATISANASWTVSVDVDSGTAGGEVCNEADLNGTACGGTLNVIVGYDNTDPLNPIPIYAAFECNPAAKASASDCETISPPEGECTTCFHDGDFCAYTQGAYGQTNPHTGEPNGAPALLLWDNFSTVFPTGIEVGIPGAGGYSMKFTSATAVAAYLPAGGTAGALDGDLVNPLTSSSGVFGGQVLTLKISVALSDAHLTSAGFGDLYYCNGSGDSLSGLQIRQILAAAETAVGGGPLPSGYTISQLNDLLNNLNANSFDNCTVGSFTTHLSKTPCP